MATYFVTDVYLKDNTPVAENVDSLISGPQIKAAADGWARNILGTYFYNDLLAKFNAQTLNPTEITLVQDWLKPAIAWRACAEIVIAAGFQLTNKGTQTQSGDYSATPEYRAQMFVQHHYADRASFYENRLLEHLIEDGSLYPEFNDDQNKDSMARKACSNQKGSAFQSGINII